MSKIVCMASTILALCVSQVAFGGTWYVDGSVSDSGDGTTWETAFKAIQEGIDAASDGDTVIVAEGTYNETIYLYGKNIVLRSRDPLDADVVANTIIDGDRGGSVVTFDGSENGTCVLSGFTVQNGNASIGGGIHGAGLAGTATHATIENNVVTSNWAADWGGGLAFCDGVIQNNRISDNECSDCAGLYACDGLIQNNVISRNAATPGGGGALGLCGGIIRNNLIALNSAAYGGGLMGCCGIIQNNTIVGNSGGGGGGGLFACAGTTENCIIWGNTASSFPQVAVLSQPTYSCI